MGLKVYEVPRKTTKNSGLAQVAITCALALLIAFVAGFILTTPDRKKDYAAKGLGLMRVVSTDNGEYIATADGVCIVPATFIRDERTGEMIIWVQQGDTMHAIRSEQDLMNMCK